MTDQKTKAKVIGYNKRRGTEYIRIVRKHGLLRVWTANGRWSYSALPENVEILDESMVEDNSAPKVNLGSTKITHIPQGSTKYVRQESGKIVAEGQLHHSTRLDDYVYYILDSYCNHRSRKRTALINYILKDWIKKEIGT